MQWKAPFLMHKNQVKMRYIFFPGILLPLIFFGACSSKTTTRQEGNEQISLTGTWELREAQNGMMPTASYTAGNGAVWQFAENDFQQYQKDSVVQTGTYKLVPDATASEAVGLQLSPGEFTHRIVLNGDTTEKTFVGLRGDTLQMIRGYFPVDAGSRQVYVRTGGRR